MAFRGGTDASGTEARVLVNSGPDYDNFPSVL